MAIEYVTALNAAREPVGLIDTAQSIIWHSVFFGVGDFEIYTAATPKAIELLKIGNWITRGDDVEVGYIEKNEISRNANDGLMIVASGRFAKSILDRRHIMRFSASAHQNEATVLSGNVESAARLLVTNNAISCSWDTRRNVPDLYLGSHSGSTAIILDKNGNPAEKQVSYENLLTYSDSLLQEYGLGSSIVMNEVDGKLYYVVFSGADRTTTNTSGNTPVIFSTSFENLSSSKYDDDRTNEKTAAYVGGKGEGLERFYAELAGSETGLSRRETFVNASSLSKTYKGDQDQEQEYTDAVYAEMLRQKGKQELLKFRRVESFSGEIDVTNRQFVFGRDYALGDLVTMQDDEIDKYANVRITETTEVQDVNGYQVKIKYE